MRNKPDPPPPPTLSSWWRCSWESPSKTPPWLQLPHPMHTSHYFLITSNNSSTCCTLNAPRWASAWRKSRAVPSSTSPGSGSNQHELFWKMVFPKYLKGWNDITLGDASHCAEVLDAEGASEVPEDLQEDPGPVGAVGELAQVREGLLRASRHLRLMLEALG